MHYTEVLKLKSEEVVKWLIPGPIFATQYCLRMSWINKLDVTVLMQGYKMNILNNPYLLLLGFTNNIASFFPNF